MGLAMDMLKNAKNAMVPPFEISVFADPSGAFTTAAALVSCVEKELIRNHGKELKDCKALVFGGTGPVGIATGVIASLAGATTALVEHMSLNIAEDTAKEYNRRFSSQLIGVKAGTDAEKIELIKDADIIFCTAKAGIQVLSNNVLKHATQLKVAGDVNAVPPLGIEAIKSNDSGVALSVVDGAVGVGSLAVGNVKYRTQQQMLKLMLETEKPLYLDFRNAFEKAREIVKNK